MITIEKKDKKLTLFENGKFLFVDGNRMVYGDFLLLEMPTSNLLSIRMHNLVEKRIAVDENDVERLLDWLMKLNNDKKTFKESKQKTLLKKNKEIVNEKVTEQVKEE